MAVFEEELIAATANANRLDHMAVALSVAGPEKAYIQIKDGSYVGTISGTSGDTTSKTFEYSDTALLEAIDSSPGFLTFSFHSYDSDGQVLNYSQRRLLIVCNAETPEEQARTMVLCLHHHDTINVWTYWGKTQNETLSGLHITHFTALDPSNGFTDRQFHNRVLACVSFLGVGLCRYDLTCNMCPNATKYIVASIYVFSFACTHVEWRSGSSKRSLRKAVRG